MRSYWIGLPRWLSGKESLCRYRRRRFDPWVGKIPWRREWQPTPVFLLGKLHGQRSQVGYSPWDHKGSDMAEWLSSTHVHTGLAVSPSPRTEVLLRRRDSRHRARTTQVETRHKEEARDQSEGSWASRGQPRTAKPARLEARVGREGSSCK